MNKKKLVHIMTVILLILVCFAVIIIATKNHNEKKQEETTNQEEATEQISLDTVEEAVPEQVELTEKADANESEWLAAGMVIAVSLQYPEFNIEDIYVSEEVAYIVFSCEGERIAIYSEPIDEERTEPGTRDLYTKDLGFATFDEVDADSLDTDNLTKISVEDLETLISQSLLVSVYEH